MRAGVLLARVCSWAAALGLLCAPGLRAFNLAVDERTEYSGPEGSYFGYAVDFHVPAARTAGVLVGAPRANTSQPDIVQGGAVYFCPWPGSARCRQIPFDNTNVAAWLGEAACGGGVAGPVVPCVVPCPDPGHRPRRRSTGISPCRCLIPYRKKEFSFKILDTGSNEQRQSVDGLHSFPKSLDRCF